MTSSLCHITPLLESTHNSRQFLCAISARSFHTCKYTENISFDIQNVICIKKEISWLVISIAMANFVPFCKNGKTVLQNLVSIAIACQLTHLSRYQNVPHKVLVPVSFSIPEKILKNQFGVEG